MLLYFRESWKMRKSGKSFPLNFTIQSFTDSANTYRCQKNNSRWIQLLFTRSPSQNISLSWIIDEVFESCLYSWIMNEKYSHTWKIYNSWKKNEEDEEGLTISFTTQSIMGD